MIIGRPREYMNEKYIVTEILKKVDNPAWIELRKKEFNKFLFLPPPQKKKKKKFKQAEVCDGFSTVKKIHNFLLSVKRLQN